MPYRPSPLRSPKRVLPPNRRAWRRVNGSMPQPLSTTDTWIGVSSSPEMAVIDMAIAVAPAWMELSTSSEIALEVPLYPESRVAWMNLSRAMMEQSCFFRRAVSVMPFSDRDVFDPSDVVGRLIGHL